MGHRTNDVGKADCALERRVATSVYMALLQILGVVFFSTASGKLHAEYLASGTVFDSASQ